MTTPTSGAISLANVQSEFGGTNPISLSEYYSGGTYVTGGTTGGNGTDGITAGTVIPTSSKIRLANFYSASSVPPSITIGGKSVTYSAGKTFDYYDSVVSSATDVNITVSQDMSCTVTMCGSGGSSTQGNSWGGGSIILTFTFTFKAGVTYVLRLGTPGGQGAGGSGAPSPISGVGGGYSALYLTSASSTNVIAVVGGGGGGGGPGAGAYGGGASPIGSPGGTAVTNGLAWAGNPGNASSTPTTVAGGGGGTAAGGTAGTGNSANGTAGGAYTGGSGSALTLSNYGGGGGSGYYGGGGGGYNSGPSVGGGGAGSSFLYTANDASGKTAALVSVSTGLGGTVFTQNASRPGFCGSGGSSGNNTGTVTLSYWANFGNWRTVYPGGSAIPASWWTVALAADYTPGATTISMAYKITTSASSLASSSTLTFGADPRRLANTTASLEFTISGTTYTKAILSASSVAINLTTTLGVAVPAGTVVYVYPVNSNVSTTIGALNVGPAFRYDSACAFRLACPDGTWVYGWFPGSIGWSGGTTSASVATPTVPLYPYTTIPKGSEIQRTATTAADSSNSYAKADMAGATVGVIRIAMT